MNHTEKRDQDDDGNDHDRFSYKCRLCGKSFDNLVDMQRHELVVHVQHGNVPQEKD